MIFEPLHESAQRGELLLIDGGYCRWHQRRDGTVTIYEIISLRPGAGWEMLSTLINRRPHAITARCPVSYPSNDWWRRRGFALAGVEMTRSGTPINVWRLNLGNDTE